MTINEFNAWLDGFSEAIGEAPTPEQWARIRAKLAEVREAGPVVPTIITDPFRPASPSIPQPFPRWEITCGQLTTSGLEAVMTN